MPRPKYSPGIMVWGAISYRGKSDLIIVKGTVDSVKYQEILTKAEPKLKQLYPRGFIFQQDGARCHTSGSSMSWFATRGWQTSEWPANSPDLNPTENAWGLMKNEVEKRKPKNLQELEAIIREVWENLDLEYIKSLIESMPDRIQKCIDLEGDRTGY